MELGQVKQIFCEQGEVRRILDGNTVLWEKPGSILVKDFKHYRYATYVIPAPAEDVVWEVSKLPRGLSSQATPEGLTIRGYAEEVARKTVTVRATAGEQTEETVYIFDVASDGKEIAIASNDLGVWYNGESGVKSRTTALAISGSGASGSSVRYYSTGKPSWMSIGSSSGALTGTPNTGYESQSGWVSVYAIRGGENVEGSYKTASKRLRWSTTNGIPRFRYSQIRIDCTTALRAANTIGSWFFSLDLSQYYYPIEGGTDGVTYTIDETEGKHVHPVISGHTLRLQKKSRCTTTQGCDSYITIVASNAKGASGTLYVHCDVHAKSDACASSTVVESVW